MAQPVVKEVYRLVVNTGTYRDWSDYSADGCIDSVWFRSYHKSLKKIGGYKSIGYVPRYTTDDGTAILLNGVQDFAQPSFPNIQSVNAAGSVNVNAQDFTAPFLANKAQGLTSPYQLYTPNSGAPNALSEVKDLSQYTGYGVVRKTINIIQDGKNTIIGAGDVAPYTGRPTISGVNFSTNTERNLRMPAFQALSIPQSLPPVPSLATPMEWLACTPSLDFVHVVYLGGKYLGVTTTALYSSLDGITWTVATGLPAQQYSTPSFSGNFIVGATNGVYWSADGLAWTQATGITIPTFVTFGSFAGTNAGIYVTTDQGQTYAVTSLVTGSITCFASSNNVFVAGTTAGILYSQDGTTWSATNVTSGSCVKVSYINSQFIMIMSTLSNITATVMSAVDVLTWSPCKLDDLSNITIPCTDLIFSGSDYVLATSFGIYYSGDGVNYTQSELNDGTKLTASYKQVALRGTTLVVVGAADVLSSLDGITWYPTSLSSVIQSISGGPVWTTGTYYSLSDVSLIQKTLPLADNIFRPGEYVWSLDSVNLTTGEVSVAAATYVVAHPSCGETLSIDDTTEYYVFVRNLKELSTSQKVPLRWDNIDTPATDLENWLVPMVYGQNINPKTVTSPEGNFMNSDVKVSGGVCAVGPFLFAYGNEGLIRNSDVNNPSKWFSLVDQESVYRNSGLANDVNVGTSKIVKGLPYRGGGTSYAALFWSLDSLILATFVGAPAIFNYSIVSNAVTIIAANSAIELYGSFYWIGDNRFYVFSGGQINEVPNNMNRNWFFNEINPQRQHIIWASLNPQYNEIWWFFPRGDSYECNWALVYNYADQVWYDTPIHRSAGFYTGVYRHPVWVSNTTNNPYIGFDYYLHESGLNQVDFQGSVSPITCSFTTPDIGMTSSSLPATPKQVGGLKQNWVNIMRFEPDGIVAGEWSFYIKGKTNPRGAMQYPTMIYSFNESTLEVDMQEQWRVAYLHFTSSDIDADWYVGNNLLTLNVGDCEGI